MRIMHVVQTDAFAGVERYVAVLAASQHAKGDHVVVIGGNQDHVHEALGGRAVAQRPARTLVETVRAVDQWRAADVIHTHMTAAETAALLSIRTHDVPVVATRHFAQRRGRSAAGHLAAPLIRRRISAQIAVSRYVAQRIDGECVVIHPGVPSVENSRPSAQRNPTVLVAQRLEWEKRTDVALRAFTLSGLAAQGWRMEVAGVGAQRRELERLSATLGVEDAVSFLGFRSDMPGLMQRSSLLLASSPAEHFGLTVVEAMAAGLPVVATGAAGHLETVGAAAGAALFAPADAAEAGSVLARLAGDPAARDRYAEELVALQRERFSLEAQVDAIDAVYRGLL